MGFAGFVDTLLQYANDVVIVFIGLALVVFLWGLTKYVAAGGDAKKRTEGRDVIIWGVIGLSVMVGVWGFVRIISNVFDDAASGGGYQYTPSRNGGRNNSGSGFPTGNDETIHGDIPVPTNQFPV